MSQRSSRGVDREAQPLQQYTLQEVQETGVELGRGSYAAVYTVEYKGLTCAAKNFHPTLYQQEYSMRRFQEECAILSKLKHPNIVQFLGVYYQPGSILPALVMECLPMTLAQCLDQYGVLPNEIGYSILKDVALALSYLHQHDPPILHRDLSANNVLLTCGMTAKISDLGMAKHLFPASRNKTMTETPGNANYMPPETRISNPRYDNKVDVFSYGVLMIHLFSAQWPIRTTHKVDPQDGSNVIPNETEVDCYQEKLDAIGGDHPLITLILRCLHNSPTRRPEAFEILTQVNRVAAQFSALDNKLELLQQVASLKADTERLQQEHKVEITSMREDAERLQQEYATEIRSLREISSAELESTRQTLQADIRSAQMQQREAEKAVEEIQRKLEDAERCHSVEVKQLNLKFTDTRDTLSLRVGEVEAELRAAQQQISSKNSALSDRDNEVAKLTGQMMELRKEMVDHLTTRKNAFAQNLLAKDKQLAKAQRECDLQLLAKDQILVEKQKQFDQQIFEKQKAFDQQLFANEKIFKQKLLASDQVLAEKDQRERELDQTLLAKEQLLFEKDQFLLKKDQQLHQLREKQTETSALLQSKEAILSAKDSLVASKDDIIRDLHEQLDHLRKSHVAQVIERKDGEISSMKTRLEYLSTQLKHLNTAYLALNPFPKGTHLKWQKCKDMKNGMSCARTVLIRGRVYVGGGDTEDGYDTEYLIHEYHPIQEKWSTLPPAPVCWFGMGELNRNLVLVGGKTVEGFVTEKVHTFDKSSQEWKESMSPMPTARRSVAVFSQPSCLTVVGGRDQDHTPLTNVEIFIVQTSQWYKASPAPFPLALMTTTVIHNKCFLGEYLSNKVHQLCVSVGQVTIDSAIVPHMITEWKALPDLPYQQFSLCSFGGCLLAVGGEQQHRPITTIQSYSPITNTWEMVGDLPDKRCVCSTIILPTGELLVVGGESRPLFSLTKKVWRAALI